MAGERQRGLQQQGGFGGVGVNGEQRVGSLLQQLPQQFIQAKQKFDAALMLQGFFDPIAEPAVDTGQPLHRWHGQGILQNGF